MADPEVLAALDDINHEIRQVRWYLGLVTLIAGVALLFFLLWLFGVITVNVQVTR